MFKKVLQAATAFGVLLAGYAGYVRTFAVVADSLARARSVSLVSVHADSRTKTQANKLAVRSFGRGHWAADGDLAYRYYNAERGFWMYARDYKRSADGKTLEFSPFALIWQSRDGKAVKTVTCASATIDLDKPLGFEAKPESGPLRVLHARLEGDVVIRDDKGTPGDPSDDLMIGPLTYVEYDEPTLEVRSESDVVIEDRDLRVTAVGLLIKLRPKDEPTAVAAKGAAPASSVGFNGAQSITLKKTVHIVVGDVGPSGILPGNARAGQKAGAKTPLELRNDGIMQVDLPRPRVDPPVGPPSPREPTIAQFFRNVTVLRGKPSESPDRLDCDHLRLVLIPAEKVPAAAAPTPPPPPAAESVARADAGDGGEVEAPAAGTNGPLTDLTLKRAEADGHNVWITSVSQGFKAQCKELIHKKQMPDAPDETYLRGEENSKLVVTKVDVATDGPNKGKVVSFTTIRTIDATIFDSGKGNDASTIVARGPGDLESRPAPDLPVERTARWDDQLTLQTDPAPAAKDGAAAGRDRKRITLTGSPGFSDVPAKSTLAAENTLVVWLKPKGDADVVKASAKEGGKPAPASAAQSFEIEKLVALKNVRLTAPGKTLTARERLDAEFEPSPSGVKLVSLSNAPATATASSSAAPAAATPPAPAQPRPAATPPAPPADPEARAVANRVWARLNLKDAPAAPARGGSAPPAAPALLASAGPGGGRRAEIDKVYLLGAVEFHQDPAPGKSKGTDVVGEAVHLVNQGDGLTKFVVFHDDPYVDPARAGTPVRPAALGPPAKPRGDGRPLARIETDELTIRGELIGLDQSIDQAWVDGAGDLTMMAAKSLLSDKTPVTPDPASKAPTPAAVKEKKAPFTIAWVTGMRLFGRSTDPQGRVVARAEFYDDVRAANEDSTLACDDIMRVYFDKPVKLNRPRAVGVNAPAGSAAEEGRTPASAQAGEPKPDLALIECVNNVVVVNRKLDPAGSGQVMEKQRITGEYLIYERATGKFRVPGAGEVFLYNREGAAAATPGFPGAANRPQVAPKAKTRTAGKAKALPPLTLTQVKFSRDMLGRFGSGKETDKNKKETRWADFFGDVEAQHGRVADADTVLDPDDRRGRARDYSFMTAQVLRVVAEPNLKDPSPDAPPRYLLRAWENANASTDDKTIAADTITFDSEKDLFYAYGEDGRNVMVTQQENVGQGFSPVTGRAAMYNHKTGEAQLIEPGALALIHNRTGKRPEVKGPEPVVKPMRPKQIPFRNLRGNIERKDFNGR